MEWVVRRAAECDYPVMARIQMLSPEAAQWPVGDYSNFNVLVGCHGDSVAGFCAWRQTANDEAELLNLAVHPALRKKGLARALLEELRRMAKGDIFLEVEENNGAALSLYRNAGFTEISNRGDYYGRGRNAIVMKIRSW